MNMDVYADLLFLVDFCMDYVSLVICARAAGVELRCSRAALGAAFGGAYSVAALFFSSGILGTVLAVVSWILISLIAFYRKGDKAARLLKLALIFLGSEAVLGGVVSAAFSVLGRMSALGESIYAQMPADNGSPWVFLSFGIGALAAYFLISVIKKARLDSVALVRIVANGKEVTVSAFLDSGNLLREPMSGRPCTLVCASDIESLLGKDTVEALRDGSVLLCPLEKLRIFAVPTRTVDGRSLLYAFLPDEVSLLDESGKRLKRVDTLIAVRKDGDGAGRAILPAGLI